MTVSIDSDDAVINGVNLTVQGSDLTTPASGHAILYAKSDHLYIRLDDGTVVDIGPAAGGGVATDTIWDTAGDLAVGSGSNTAAKLALGAAYKLLGSDAAGTALAYGPVFGDWSGTIQVTQAGNRTSVCTYAWWVRLGNLAVVAASLKTFGAGSANNEIAVGGIPTAVQPANATDSPCAGVAYYFDQGSAHYHLAVRMINTTTVAFQRDGGNDSFGKDPSIAIAANDLLSFILVYKCA